jgi:hypothetical protein
MCKDYLCFCVECFDLCFWISTFVVPVITYIVIQGLRPRLSITALRIEDTRLKVKVTNKSYFFDANNLRIEICIYNKQNGYTYHFEPDHTDFLILPSRSFFLNKDATKVFVSRKAAESAIIILNEERDKDDKKDKNQSEYTPFTGYSNLIAMLNEGYKVRVRCHAYHSFSGLGKSFEKTF